MPRYSVELLRPAAALARRLHDALPGDVNPARRACRLLILGIRLADLGDKCGALAPTEEAVASYGLGDKHHGPAARGSTLHLAS